MQTSTLSPLNRVLKRLVLCNTQFQSQYLLQTLLRAFQQISTKYRDNNGCLPLFKINQRTPHPITVRRRLRYDPFRQYTFRENPENDIETVVDCYSDTWNHQEQNDEGNQEDEESLSYNLRQPSSEEEVSSSSSSSSEQSSLNPDFDEGSF
ncbi:hypothetical protein FGO68_gene11476 [Halteria grandinella]|uniref:Uncharacterized protein n=1 Tax=Halteria grandinella TaxID=5974 RepID=A0A8J8T929_HALGN|nr:hypothetical protein FGO68_gene11476 [Halteria grandinella]